MKITGSNRTTLKMYQLHTVETLQKHTASERMSACVSVENWHLRSTKYAHCKNHISEWTCPTLSVVGSERGRKKESGSEDKQTGTQMTEKQRKAGKIIKRLC